MRLHAPLGALTGIAWLASAAAVPRNGDIDVDTDSTCTSTLTEQATIFVTEPQSTSTGIFGPVPVLTVTLAPGTVGSVFGTPPGSLGSAIPFTVTVTEGFTSSETPTGQPGQGSPVSQISVPGISEGSVVTVTIPEGPSNTATVVLTVTVPESGSPGSWSTVITAPSLTTRVPVPVSPVPVSPESLSDSGSSWFPLTIETITVSLGAISSPTNALSFPTAGPSSGVSSSSCSTLSSVQLVTYTILPSGTSPGYTAVFTVTQSLPTISATLQTISTALATVSVIPVTIPVPSSPGQGSQPVGSMISPLTITIPAATVSVTVSTDLSTPSAGPLTVLPGLLTTVTIPQAGSGQPGTVTLTIPEVTVPEGSSTSNTGIQSGVITVTIPQSTTSVSFSTPSSPGSGVLSSQTGSIVAVTYTVPGESGASPSLYTVTYTELPSATGLGFSTPALTGQSPTSSSLDDYGTSFSSSTPQFSQSVETITIGGSVVSSQSIGVETVTVIPGGASGTPFVVTYTPITTVSHAPETVTIASSGGFLTSPGGTMTPSSEISPLTVTVVPAGGSGSPVIITYTPDVTVTSLVSSTSNVPTPVVVTVSPTDASGTPFVFTYTPPETVSPVVASDTTGLASITASILTVTVGASSSPTPSFVSGGPGYDGGVSSSVGSGSVGPTVITVTPSSGSPFVVTISENTVSGTLSGQPAVSTVTASPPSASGGISIAAASPTVFTLSMPSGSPIVVTLSGSGSSAISTTQETVVTITEGAPSASSGGVVTITEEASSALSGGVVTITEGVSTVGGGVVTVTEVISTAGGGVATITEVVSATAGASSPSGSVITFTPPSGSPVVVTIPASVNSITAPTAGSGNSVTTLSLSQSLLPSVLTITGTGSVSTTMPSVLTVTPVVVTYTLSSAYDHGSTVLTYTTDLPVASIVPSSGGVFISSKGVFTSPEGVFTSESVVTLPGGVTTLTLTASPGYTQTPKVVTIWPSVLTVGPSTTSCTLQSAAAESNSDAGASPSETTIWPLPSSESCTTLSTIYLPSSTTSHSDPATPAQFSVITLSPTSSCTETSSLLASDSISIALSPTPQSLSPTPKSTVGPNDSSSAEPSDVFPPPQTEVASHGHTTRGDNETPLVITILASSTLGGYVFSSPDGYGDPVPGYGTPVPAVTSSLTILASLTQPGLPTVEPTPGTNATVPAITTISAEPTATSTSLALPIPGQNTTLSTQSGIVSSTVVLSSDSSALIATVPSSVTSILATLPSGWSLSTQSPTDIGSLSASDSLPTLSSIVQSPTIALLTPANSASGQLPTFSDTTLPTALNSTVAPMPTSISTADIFTSGVAPLSGTAASSELLTTAPASTVLSTPVVTTSIAPLNGTAAPSGLLTTTTSSTIPPTLLSTLAATTTVAPPVTGGPSGNVSTLSGSELSATVLPTSATLLTTLLTSVTTGLSNSTASSTVLSVGTTTGAASSSLVLLTSTTSSLTTEATLTTLPVTTASLNLNSTAGPTATAANVTSTAPTSTIPTSSQASATCGAAGDRGEVVFNFDDIPSLSFGNDTDFPPQPVPFPYHRFFFSGGFHVVPPPTSKYEPSSASQMVQYNTSSAAIAQIGLAQLRENPCFRFDLLGVGLGCNSTDLPCVFGITGLQWNGSEEVVQANRTFEIAACLDTANCTLSHQVLDSAAASTFSNLTSINITLTVANQPQTWWADDLQVAWTDNDCNAATCRSRVPDTIMFPHSFQTVRNKAKGILRWATRRGNIGDH